MRVALTGARGFVGSALRRALAANGVPVTALSRTPPDDFPSSETWIAGELADADALAQLVRDADAVVHAAAWVHRETSDPATRDACFAVNLRGTEKLLEAIARRRVALPFVNVGTTAVYGDRFVDRDESGPCEPAGAYGESKLAAERAVLAASAAGRVRAVALRPAMVFGRGAPGNIASLTTLVRRGVAPLVAGGRNRKSMVHDEDLAAVIQAALARAESVAGGIFNVASEPAPTLREVGDALAAGLGRGLVWVPVPGALWSAGAALGHLPSRASGGRRADLGRTMEVYASSTTVRAAALTPALGVRLRETVAGLRESVAER
jgi:nucleoside-diphosphate-sugar epimerase